MSSAVGDTNRGLQGVRGTIRFDVRDEHGIDHRYVVIEDREARAYRGRTCRRTASYTVIVMCCHR
jgi:hypothetical protein